MNLVNCSINNHFLYKKDEKGKLNGEFKIFSPNGLLLSIGNFKNDLVNGQYQEFNVKGKLNYQAYINSNLRDGETIKCN